MATVSIIQTFKHRWKIVTENGTLLQDHINLSSAFEADEYVRRYISSFQGWTYDVIPLKKETV